MSLLLLVDGNALLYRAFHAMPDLSGPDREPTNAVYGFISMLYKATEDFHPSHIIVCFDAKGPNFRNELLSSYQEHRPPAPDRLITQMALVREMLDRAHVVRSELEGYEADDLIGTLSHKYHTELSIKILTGDKDLLQLVNTSVSVIMLKTGLTKLKEYHESQVKEDFGITPSQIPDWKAFMGDPSDGYKGVPGVGPKTAVNLISQFGTLENVYNTIDDVTNNTLKELLQKEKEQAILCKNLATIRTNVPITVPLESARFDGFHDGLRQFFVEHRFRTLHKRIFGTEIPSADSNQSSLFS